MKSPVKLLISVLAFGLMTSLPALRAQDNPPPATPPADGQQPPARGGRGGRGQMTPAAQVANLEKAVGTLTDDQKTKITAIYEKLAKDRQALAQEDRRTKGPELMQAANKEIRALLTADQQTKFDAMPAPGRGGRRAGGGGGGN